MVSQKLTVPHALPLRTLRRYEGQGLFDPRRLERNNVQSNFGQDSRSLPPCTQLGSERPGATPRPHSRVACCLLQFTVEPFLYGSRKRARPPSTHRFLLPRQRRRDETFVRLGARAEVHILRRERHGYLRLLEEGKGQAGLLERPERQLVDRTGTCAGTQADGDSSPAGSVDTNTYVVVKGDSPPRSPAASMGTLRSGAGSTRRIATYESRRARGFFPMTIYPGG